MPGIAENANSPYTFDPKDLKTGLFTGLEVSHEPGQWAVWAGVVLMAVGLTFVFYVVHIVSGLSRYATGAGVWHCG